MVYFPGILKTRNCAVERLVFCAQQHPRGICVCVFWEEDCFSLLNGKARPLLTVTLLCGRASSQCYCVLTGSYFHSRSVSKAGRGRNMPSDAHSWLQAHPLTCVCVQTAGQSHTQARGPEQWHAAAQDVYVISRVCEKLFSVAVETKCNIEKSLPPLPPFLLLLSLSLSSSLWLPPPPCREKPVSTGEPGHISNSSCRCQAVSNDTWQRQSFPQRHVGRPGESCVSLCRHSRLY